MPNLKDTARPGYAAFAVGVGTPCASDPDRWFPKPNTPDREIAAVKRLCRACPVRAECLRSAFDRDEMVNGIFGGMTPAERRAAKRRSTERAAASEGRVLDVQRPQRAKEQWRWASAWRVTESPARLFEAAREVKDGGLRRGVEAQWGIRRSSLCDAVTILRWAPDMEPEVVDGWVPFAAAVGYARRVRDARQAQAA